MRLIEGAFNLLIFLGIAVAGIYAADRIAANIGGVDIQTPYQTSIDTFRDEYTSLIRR